MKWKTFTIGFADLDEHELDRVSKMIDKLVVELDSFTATTITEESGETI